MEIALFILIIFVIGSIGYYTWAYGISPMPTLGQSLKGVVEQIPPYTAGPIYELGSGWGHLLVALAKHCPQAKIVGFEISPIPYWVSQLWVKLSGVQAQVERKDFFEADLSQAVWVVCYLYPGAMQKLANKFHTELPAGCRIITHTFALPGWVPIRTIQLNDLYRTKVYVYEKKAEWK
jgi:hypothetical protein